MNTRKIAVEYRLAHWAGLMHERVASGLSIKQFCENVGIHQNVYFYWQRKLRAAACEDLAIPQEAEPRFAEIKLEPQQLVLPPESEPCQIRIEVCGMQITADSTYPPDKLASFVRELTRP